MHISIKKDSSLHIVFRAATNVSDRINIIGAFSLRTLCLASFVAGLERTVLIAADKSGEEQRCAA